MRVSLIQLRLARAKAETRLADYERVRQGRLPMRLSMSVQPLLALENVAWVRRRDGDPTLRVLYDRHYSRRKYRDGRRPAKIVGPGEYIALMSEEADAVFVWRKFISMDAQVGVNCAVFRNEGARLSSDLGLEAERIAWERWPGERLYTYVNPAAVESTNPGYCFKMAGWVKCGETLRGLHVLEKVA